MRRQRGGGLSIWGIRLIRNERLKLLATALNNLGLAFAIGGFVAPAISLQVHGWSGLVVLVWLGLGAGLHGCVQAVLGRMQG